MQDIDHWLALHTVDGIGPTLFRRLLDRFGSPREAFLERSSSALLAIGLSSHSIEQTHRFSDLQRQVAKDLQWLSDPNHHLLTIQDSNYPVLLKEIPQPPPLLFIKGDPDCMSKLQIAMVGSRNPTGAGRDTATAFARSLSKADVVVTSGMAAGIDAASHHGALQGPFYCGTGHWGRSGLSGKTSEACSSDRRKWRTDLGIPTRYRCYGAELPKAKPNYQWSEPRCPGCRGQYQKRLIDHGRICR
ncbi:MAG: DNA-processing protein DprA [Pseudomonadales bacterium]|nr:DNA-processing protein DprA [Pseudomonadales bacterium]MDP7360927.1 DNA-processing protein DprA [Pseudomonadales bacterium]HJN52064.1 DNA-processing protein DprA [Pseudomonadales bacterium]